MTLPSSRVVVLCWLTAMVWLGLAPPGVSLDLQLPAGAVQTREFRVPSSLYYVPIDGFSEGQIPSVEAEGDLLQRAWRLDGTGLTTLQIMQPLRDQLTQAGYDILLDCSAPSCGGFDFRFGTLVFPAPDMFVDLFDYRFVSARSGQSGTYKTVLVSRVSDAGYIQVISLDTSGAPAVAVDPRRPKRVGQAPDVDAIAANAQATSGIGTSLEADGSVILSDLEFETGSVELSERPYASLVALAEYLNSDGKPRVALVGHTDAVGALDSNVALSRRRAAAVLERLVAKYDVAREQLEAEGMGYLAPVASNLTQAGREANRRVEAVLLNTE